MDQEIQNKGIEMARYGARAISHLEDPCLIGPACLGSESVPYFLSTPYQCYEQAIAALIGADSEVLELGAGEGRHTLALVKTGARVTATDISPHALEVLKRRITAAGEEVITRTADIESLPFLSHSFDAIVCAGSLSYGDIERISAEIERVLRPGGCLICVDSLNHNPIYRFNRWLQWKRGLRTETTYNRIPDTASISRLGCHFDHVATHFFGSISFAMPLVAKLLGQTRAKALSDGADRLIDVRKAAFKFVLVAKNLRSPIQGAN
jgi:ubiquinone/menaquinone biosynthesis C-methylase UbiE